MYILEIRFSSIFRICFCFCEVIRRVGVVLGTKYRYPVRKNENKLKHLLKMYIYLKGEVVGENYSLIIIHNIYTRIGSTI